MSTSTSVLLPIPVTKGDLSLPVNANDGVRTLLANAVTKYFNVAYMSVVPYVSPESGATLAGFWYNEPLNGVKVFYETSITEAALIALGS